ncbi:MAG: glycosyltransferase [Clostridiales bacterium]|nr:glycosyltransferase [Clostridiales bacterium]
MSRILTGSNIRKTGHYLKKNGILHAYYAVRERMEEAKRDDYVYCAPTEEALEAQRRESAAYPYLFSIVVPAYETKEEFLREMIDSVRGQSYRKWELIIVDAGGSDGVEQAVREIMDQTGDTRMKYRRLTDNQGISGNTNEGIALAAGDYIALLDHDDFITPDALYHMARKIQESTQLGRTPALLYSDEDKYDQKEKRYHSPHRKQEFNLDLMLSNNYICHFMAVEAGLMKRLKLRGEYDGAQDYDLALRVIDSLRQQDNVTGRQGGAESVRWQEAIVHIPRILYHWRCHEDSTSENTASKTYAYEAGRAAVAEFCRRQGWEVAVGHSLHLGFYEISYRPDILTVRDDVGIVGGRLLDGRRRICGGAYDAQGRCLFEGLHREYSGGMMHRAVLKQDCAAVDVRCMQLRAELRPVFTGLTGLPYQERSIRVRSKQGTQEMRIADVSALHCGEAGYRRLSLEMGRAAANMEYRVLWNPAMTIRVP